ncbi:integral membrane transport protein [Novymonas esmeraldas]|uniref:Integral membrane transport protein n=1 Tax=Novymonas esmeraldas TaxID=1808958 RepID=A0AAW0ETZ2_9TRYP
MPSYSHGATAAQAQTLLQQQQQQEMQQPQHYLGNYFSTTYTELFKAHVLDVHLPNMLIGISASIEVPLVTILGRRIGASYSAIADFIAVAALCRTLLDIPLGVMVEYVGVRNVMFACLLLNIAASFVGLTVASSTTLFLFCMLSGISLGGFFLARHIFVAGISSKKYRGLLMAILSGLLRWSHVIGPIASGLFASYWGDVRYSFIMSATTSTIAFTTLAFATWSTRYQEVCEQSCATSHVCSAASTPHHSDVEEDGAADALLYTATPLLPPPAVAAATTTSLSSASRSGRAGSTSDAASHRVIVGAETHVGIPPPHTHHHHHQLHFHSSGAGAEGAAAARSASCSVASLATVRSVHPDMGAAQAHHFHLSTIWSTFIDYWTVIWRLGLYIILATALRANRKLLVSFAGMRASMTDAQVSYLLGFSFIFDAILFPLGGLVMDLLGRQFAMVPVAVGLGSVFFFLPFCTSERQLYAAAAAFGIVDALGCGLIMTLTADRAPPRYGAPFFGIMRTVQDMGHVVGARGVSTLVRYAGFDVCCWTLGAFGLVTAAWGVYGVPRDTDTMPETPRLQHAAVVAQEQRLRKHLSNSQSSEETVPLRAAPAMALPPSVSYGTATTSAAAP